MSFPPVTVLVLVPVQEPTVGGTGLGVMKTCVMSPLSTSDISLKTGLHSGHGGVLITGKMLMFMLSEIKQGTQLCIQNKYSYVNREETGRGKEKERREIH